MNNDNPLVFISHKHVDQKIARILADFLTNESRTRIDIHNSSDARYYRPAAGERLTDQLRRVLWKTHVLILIYTQHDLDWSWCMYEAGIANDSHSPDTRVVVFQCGDEPPKQFAGQVHVDLRELGSIQSFLMSFFRGEDYFPGLGRALTPDWSREGIFEAGKRLFDNLDPVLPGKTIKGSVWPYARFEISEATAKQIEEAPHPDRTAMRELVSGSARIAESSASAIDLFGRITIESMSLKELLQSWSEQVQGESPWWHASCCDQIAAVVRGNLPVVPQTPIRKPNSYTDLIPNLVRHRNQREFEFFFVDASNPQGIRVEDCMLKTGEFVSRRVNEVADSTKLLDFLETIDERNRIPFLTATGQVEYIIHRSVIDGFLVRRRDRIQDVTLGELLSDPQRGALVRESIAFVAKTASLADARRAMTAKPNCLDVFMTENGVRTEPVIGWLTNVDMRRKGLAATNAG